MKTAVVLGATGLVGTKLIDQLIKENDVDKIIAITRRPIEYLSSKVTNKVINFNDLETYSHAFKGCVLFSCLGTTAKKAGSIEAQRQIDFKYQKQVAKMAAVNGIHHYVLVSSAGADSKSRNPYLKMKGELEEAVSLLPFERISILRPSLLLGEREDFRLGETLGSWVLPVLCHLPFLKKYRPISADEVAKKMLSLSLSSKRPEGSKEIFQLDEVFMDAGV